MTLTVEKTGRRFYIVGNTYPIKDEIKSAGCKWDAERRAWWTGKVDVAEQLASKADSSPKNEAPGLDAKVAGRATYKGRPYYLAARMFRGQRHWDDGCEPVTSRDGAKNLLISRDGSMQFWAAEVQVTKLYHTARSIRALQEFAKNVDAAGGGGARHGQEYCYHRCPVGGFRCCPENGPCHDCE